MQWKLGLLHNQQHLCRNGVSASVGEVLELCASVGEIYGDVCICW